MRNLLLPIIALTTLLLAGACSSDDAAPGADAGAICAAINQPCTRSGECCEGTCRGSSAPDAGTVCICENEGSACAEGADCCSGQCGGAICREAACLALDQPCATTLECCGDTVCDEGACTACAPFGDDCSGDDDCCSGSCSTTQGCLE